MVKARRSSKTYPPRRFIPGKIQKGYVLPLSLIERIEALARLERKRPCRVVERLLAKGLDDEPQGSESPAS